MAGDIGVYEVNEYRTDPHVIDSLKISDISGGALPIYENGTARE